MGLLVHETFIRTKKQHRAKEVKHAKHVNPKKKPGLMNTIETEPQQK